MFLFRSPELAFHKFIILADSFTAGPWFEVKDVPGKGKGVVASRLIPRGTRILVEAALMPAVTPEQVFSAILRAFDKFSPEKREAYLKLYNRAPESYKDPAYGWLSRTKIQKKILGIYGANVADEDGVFEIGSRFNHACIPNVYISRHPGLVKSIFHATRDIETSEELTVSYVLELDTEPREAKFLEQWGFVWACHVCSGPDSFELQRKRSEIVELQRNKTMKGKEGALDLMARLQKAAGMLVSIGLEGDNLQHL